MFINDLYISLLITLVITNDKYARQNLDNVCIIELKSPIQTKIEINLFISVLTSDLSFLVK